MTLLPASAAFRVGIADRQRSAAPARRSGRNGAPGKRTVGLATRASIPVFVVTDWSGSRARPLRIIARSCPARLESFWASVRRRTAGGPSHCRCWAAPNGQPLRPASSTA